MKYFILFLLLLAGCNTTKLTPTEPKVIKEVSYVVRIPSKEMISLPAQIEKIDVDTATQADAAKFITQQAIMIEDLNSKLISIAKFLVDEQSKLDTKAAEENIKSKQSALKNQ